MSEVLAQLEKKGGAESLKSGEYIVASRQVYSGAIQQLISGVAVNVNGNRGCFAVNLKGLNGTISFYSSTNYEGDGIVLKSDGSVDYPSIWRSTSISGQTYTLSTNDIDLLFFCPTAGSSTVAVKYTSA